MSDYIEIPEGTYPCMACGIHVPDHGKARVENVYSYGRETPPNRRRALADKREEYFEMTRCATCEATRERAAAVVADHPALSKYHGSAAEYRLEYGLGVAEMLGIEVSTKTAKAALLIAEHLTQPGAFIRWAARYTPFAQHDAKEHTANRERWGHVTDETRAKARDALGKTLARLNEQPVDVLHPEEGAGCLLCGVDRVRGLASRAERIWTPATGTPRTLGGSHTAKAVHGFLCPACDEARQRVGALGPTAMERAFMTHLGASEMTMSGTQLVGLVAWGVIPNVRPNDVPWEHIADSNLLMTEGWMGHANSDTDLRRLK